MLAVAVAAALCAVAHADLTARYYCADAEAEALSDVVAPAVVTEDPRIDFDFPAQFTLPSGVGTSGVHLVRWDGFFVAPVDGAYVFCLDFEHEIRLAVDDVEYLDEAAGPTACTPTQLAFQSGQARKIFVELRKPADAPSSIELFYQVDATPSQPVLAGLTTPAQLPPPQSSDFVNLLRNGGCEDGTFSPWYEDPRFSTDSGSCSNRDAVSGTQSINVEDASIYVQDVDVSHLAAEVDAGSKQLFFSVLQRGEPDDSGFARTLIEFRDGCGTRIGTSLSSSLVVSAVFSSYETTLTLPAGTRVVQILLQGRASFFDDVVLVDPAQAPGLCQANPSPIVLADPVAGEMLSSIFSYPRNADCIISLVPAGLDGRIWIDFDAFSTEAGNDFVELFDGDSISAPLVATISGSLPFPSPPVAAPGSQAVIDNSNPSALSVLSSGPAFTLRFRSDAATVLQGFFAVYTAYPTPTIATITPPGGQAGSQIVIAGSFGATIGDDPLTVTVGGLPCPVDDASDVSITCTVPNAAANGPAPVVVSVRQVPSEPATFTYIPTPIVSALEPAGGVSASVVTVVGSFSFAAIDAFVDVRVGGVACDALAVIPGGAVVCDLAVASCPNAPCVGPADVVVSHFGITSAPAPFQFVPRPAISVVTPPVSRVGREITVRGSDFGDDASSLVVAISDTDSLTLAESPRCSVVAFDAAEQEIVCQLGPIGFEVDPLLVKVYRYETESQPDGAISLPDPPVISALEPTGGINGTDLTITGRNFGLVALRANMVVLLGNEPCPVSLDTNGQDSNTIRCTVPIAPFGPLEVSVNFFDILNEEPGPSFTYARTPTISEVSPPGGAPLAAITITGTGFGDSSDDVSVTVAGLDCNIIGQVTPSSLRCIVPGSLSAGQHPIVVSRFGVPSEQGVFVPVFTVVEPRYDSIRPVGGTGGTLVTITGDFGFLQDPDDIAVTVGGLPCPLSGEIVIRGGGSLPGDALRYPCTVPTSSVLGEVPVILTHFGVEAVDGSDTRRRAALTFTYARTPVVTEVDPAVAAIGSGINVFGTSMGISADIIDVELRRMVDGSPAQISCDINTLSPNTFFACTIDDSAEIDTDAAYNVVVTTYDSLESLSTTPILIFGDYEYAFEDDDNAAGAGGLVRFSTTIGSAACDLSGFRIDIDEGSCVVDPTLTSERCDLVVCRLDGNVPSGENDVDFFYFDVRGSGPATIEVFDPPRIDDVVPDRFSVSSPFDFPPDPLTIEIVGANFGGLGSPDLIVYLSGIAQDTGLPISRDPASTNPGATDSSLFVFDYVFGDFEPDTPITLTVERRGVPSSNSFVVVRYEPVITGLSPSGGSIGSIVTVSGSGFGVDGADVQVRINDVACTATTLLSASAIACEVPDVDDEEDDPVGPVSVTVVRAGVETDPFDSFVDSGLPIVHGISPTAAVANQILNVTVSTAVGVAVVPALGDVTVRVGFGLDLCPVQSIEPAPTNLGGGVTFLVMCRLPPGIPGAGQPVQVALFETLVAEAGDTFQYIGDTYVSGIFPEGGQAGDVLTVSGGGFVDDATLSIDVGGADCPVVAGSRSSVGNRVECVLPAVAVGPATVTLSVLGLDRVSPVDFLYVEAPRILTSAPAGGRAGSTLTITGIGFGTDVALLAASVGGRPCSILENEFVAGAESTLVCVTPASTVGPHEVAVSRYGVASLPSSNPTFVFVEPPRVLAVTPPIGVTPETLVVTGTGFGEDESVLEVELVSLDTGSDSTGTVIANTLSNTQFSVLAPNSYGPYERIAISVAVHGVRNTITASSVFVAAPRGQILSLSPLGGPPGTIITIEGRDLPLETQYLDVRMDGDVVLRVVEGSLNSLGTSMQVVAPAGLAASQYSISALAYGSTLGSLQFEMADAPVVTSISPRGGPSGGMLQVSGSDLGTIDGETEIRVGGEVCVVASQSSSFVACVLPALPLGQYDVVVTRFGGRLVSAAPYPTFTYADTPSISTISPAGFAISQANDTDSPAVPIVLHIEGRNFGSDASELSVVVGGTPCSVIPASLNSGGTRISCDLPHGPTDPAPTRAQVVVLRLGNEASLVATSSVVVVPQPVLTAVEPGFGVTSGGQSITITGSGLYVDPNELSGASQIEITVGGSPCLVEELAAERIVCSTPAGFQGTAVVAVSNFAAVSREDPDYTYVEAPLVLGVDPAGGIAGQTVTVIGLSLLSQSGDPADTTITVGGEPCLDVAQPPSGVEASVLSCTVPELSPGLQPVVVMQYDGAVRSVLPDQTYIYVERPVVAGVAPRGGQEGDTLELAGQYFGGDSSVAAVEISTVGAAALLPGSLNTQGTEVGAVVPAAPPEVDADDDLFVLYSRFGVQSAPSSESTFRYVPNPTLLGVSPAGGVIGQSVTVYGAGFGDNLADLSVTFGGAPCESPVLAATSSEDFPGAEQTVTCNAPLGPVLGAAVVEVRRFAVASVGAVFYEYVNEPVVFAVSPAGGQPGTVLNVTGSGFSESEFGIRLLFESTALDCALVPGSLSSRGDSVQCTAPDFGGEFEDQVRVVARRFEEESSGTVLFAYLQPSELVSVSPTGGSGGEIVTLVLERLGTVATEDDVVVRVGGAPCEIVAGSLNAAVDGIGASTVQCRMPTGLLGLYFVSVSVLAITAVPPAGELPPSFTFSVPPTILQVSVASPDPDLPEWVWATVASAELRRGGTAGQILRVQGTNFGKGDESSVTVGGEPCTAVGLAEVLLDGSSVVRCVIPELAPDAGQAVPCPGQASIQTGVAEVEVRVERFQAQSEAAPFVYVHEVPEVGAASPPGSAVGPAGTSTPSLLTGTDFGNCAPTLAVVLGTGSSLVGGEVEVATLDTDGTRVRVVTPPNACPGPAEGASCRFCTLCMRLTRYSALAPAPADNCTLADPAGDSGVTAFRYFSAPRVAAVTPPAGTDGTELTITGTSFGASEGDVGVTVASQPCTIVPGSLVTGSADSESVCGVDAAMPTEGLSSVRCVAPAANLGSHSVVVSRFGILSLPTPFVYVAAPRLFTVSPAGGVPGSEVTITGENLGSDASFLSVTFDGEPCVIVADSINAAGTTVRCIAPVLGGDKKKRRQGAPDPGEGPVEIVVTAFGVSSTDALSFTYIGDPVVLEIVPPGGRRGDRVAIRGYNFGLDEDDLRVLIGEAECGVVEGSATVDPETQVEEIQCVISADLQPGSLDVTFLYFGVEAVSSPEFDYVERPGLLTVSPRGGRVGEIVTVTGSDFLSAGGTGASVFMGPAGGDKVECPVFDREATRMRCELPDMPRSFVGAVDVVVRQYSVESLPLRDAFIYVETSELHYIEYGSPLGLVYAVVAGLGCLMCLVTAAGIYHFRHSPMIRQVRPPFSYLIILGAFVGFLGMLSFIGEPTDVSCGMRLWLPGISFSLIFSTLLTKRWRAWRMHDDKKGRAVVISDRELLLLILALVLIEVGGLVVWMLDAPLEPRIVFGEPSSLVCDGKKFFTYSLWQLAWIVCNLIFGVFVSWKTRQIGSQFNQSKNVGFAIYNYLVVTMLVTPIVLALNPEDDMRFVIKVTGEAILAAATLGIVFGTRLYRLMLQTGNGNLQMESGAVDLSGIDSVGDETSAGASRAEVDTKGED